MNRYIRLRQKALEILNTELPEELYYHDIGHILDVLYVVNRYIRRHEIDKINGNLLRIGALLHDIGFTRTKIEHEAKGAEIAKELMPQFGYTEEEIKIVQDLIMATKIPQSPKTEMERIICDADLDYLGRRDFYDIGEKLYKELKFAGVVDNQDDWNKLQIKFLTSHSYHTEFAKTNRQPNKEKRIEELKALFED
ncbi:HD domain-containing protein [Gaetbulibacter sp. M240]|uniref:HD domain-containing protein n=1 Tax=Gaetbulibacter sp. M240 TaxID=3126511 RepID=UPI00374F1E74